ncbi:MAG: LamG-like jellyroll fold domain-containing protein [Pseudomonadales bacterium]
MRGLSRLIVYISIAAALATTAGHAVAEAMPSIGNLTGDNAVVFPADDTLALSAPATIEFWVQPAWGDALPYDPFLLNCVGPQGVRYGIVMTAEKDAIGLYSGTDWDLAEFDFSDNRLHHVAFVLEDDLTTVYIDGEYVDQLAQSVSDVEATQIHVGSFDGYQQRFSGRFGGLRLWETAIDEEDLAAYRKIAIFSEQGYRHPDFDALLAASDFTTDTLTLQLMMPPLPALETPSRPGDTPETEPVVPDRAP